MNPNQPNEPQLGPQLPSPNPGPSPVPQQPYYAQPGQPSVPGVPQTYPGQPLPQQPAAPGYPGQPATPSQQAQPAIPESQATTNQLLAQPQPVVLQPEQMKEMKPLEYEFINNPKQNNSRFQNASNMTTMQRAGIVIGGIIGVVFLLTMAGFIFSNKGPTPPLVIVAEQQTELMRVAQIGTINAISEATKDLAFNVGVTVTSEQQQLITYIKTNKIKAKASDLTMKHSAKTDTDLANAQTASIFDSVYIGIIQQDLNNYVGSIKAAQVVTTGPKGRALLQNELKDIQLLLKQSNQAAQAIKVINQAV